MKEIIDWILVIAGVFSFLLMGIEIIYQFDQMIDREKQIKRYACILIFLIILMLVFDTIN